jgi:phage-related minor tail protein
MRWNARGDKALLDWIARYERAVNKRYGEGFKPGFKRGMTEWVEENTKTTFEYGVTVAKAAAQGMSNAFENLFFDVFMGRMQQLSDYLTSFLESISRAMAQILAQQAAIGIIGSVYPDATDGGAKPRGQTSTDFPNPFTTKTGLEGRASGGPVIGGTSYLVGERGPELFTPSRSGMITPNGATVGAGNVKVIVNNNTGTRSTASVTPPKWNGREWVIGIVLDAYARNSNGFRTALGGSA